MIVNSAPRRIIGHWHPYYFNNSRRGIRKTANKGIKWHDLDHGLTKDGAWRISHGLPEKVFFGTKRMRNFVVSVVDKMRFNSYGPGRPYTLYSYAKKVGVNIEIEPKGYDKRYTEVIYWNRLARLCQHVWGPRWRKHVYVKVLALQDKDFAVRVITSASEAGFISGPTRDWNINE